MNHRDTRRLSRAENVLIFCDANQDDFSSFPLIAKHLSNISRSVARVIAARADQAPHASLNPA